MWTVYPSTPCRILTFSPSHDIAYFGAFISKTEDFLSPSNLKGSTTAHSELSSIDGDDESNGDDLLYGISISAMNCVVWKNESTSEDDLQKPSTDGLFCNWMLLVGDEHGRMSTIDITKVNRLFLYFSHDQFG